MRESEGEMDVVIRARHMDVVPDTLKDAARDKVIRLARHQPRLDHADVQFSEEHNPRIADREVCEVTLRGDGQVLRARAASSEPLMALDLVIDKLGHQMEKLH